MNKDKKIYYGWWIVIAGFLVYAFVYSAVSTAGVFTIPITTELGFYRSAYSTTALFSAIGLIIGSFVVGKLLAKISIKKVMIASMLAIALAFLGYTVSTKLWQFYCLYLVFGLGFAGATMISVPVLINNWFGPRKKGFAVSIALAGSGIGGMLMTMVLNKVVETVGWRNAYYVNAACVIAIVIMVAILVVNRPEDKGLTRLGDEATGSTQSSTTGIPYAEGKKTSVFIFILLSFFFMAVINSGVLNHQIPYFNDIGFSSSSAAAISALAVGALTIGKLLIGYMCDKIGVKKSVSIASLFLVFAIIFMGLATLIGSASYVYIFFYSVGGAVATVAVPLVVAFLFGDKDFSLYLGTINVVLGIGNPLGTILCGIIYDTTGSYSIAWIGYAICAVLSVLLQLFAFKKHQVKKIATT